MSPNPIRKAGQKRPGCLRVSYAQGLRAEASPKKWGFPSKNARKPFGAGRSPKGFSRFLRSQLRRIGLGHPFRARPRNGQAWSTGSDAALEPELQPRPPLRMRRPRSPQACQRGASPGRNLVSPGGLSIAAAERTPLPAILDIPAWGATPRRSVSDYDKEEKPGAFGYFLT